MKSTKLYDISPRDYGKVSADTRRRMSYNYALRISNSIGDGKLRRHPEKAFEAIFGGDWFMQPYATLKRVAKVMPVVKNPYESHTPYNLAMLECDQARAQVNTPTREETYRDTAYYRIARHYFTKSALHQYASRWCYGSAKDTALVIGQAVMGYRTMRQVCKENAKKLKCDEKALDKFREYHLHVRETYADYDSKWDKRLQYLPCHLRDELCADLRLYASYDVLAREDGWGSKEDSFETYLCKLLQNIFRLAGDVKHTWHNKKLAQDKLYKAIERYYKEKRMLETIKKLGLEPAQYGNRTRDALKLNRSFMRVVRTTMSAKISDDAKRATIVSLSDTIRETETTNRKNGWTPSLLATTGEMI